MKLLKMSSDTISELASTDYCLHCEFPAKPDGIYIHSVNYRWAFSTGLMNSSKLVVVVVVVVVRGGDGWEGFGGGGFEFTGARAER